MIAFPLQSGVYKLSLLYKHPVKMGALADVCCNDDEMPQKTNKSRSSIPISQPRIQKEMKQTSLQDVMVKEMIEQPPSEKIIADDEQFYDIDQFVEQRQLSNLQPKKINFHDFQVSGKYGEGSFGVVLQVQLKSEVQKGAIIKYAMKRIPREKLVNQKTFVSLKLERQILEKMSHPFITSLKFAFTDRHFFYLVMQSAEGGDGGTFINVPRRRQQFKKLGHKGVKFIAACTLLGLQYLHSQNILYRDLKVENILIFSDGYAKLSDFGLAKLINQDGELSKTHAGTALYNAPQMVLQMGYNKCVDFWALGVLIYELETGETPFRIEDVSTKLRFKRVAQEQEISRKWRGHHLSHSLKDLIAGLLKFKPQDRLGVRSWGEIKNHEYFKDFDWHSLVEKRMPSPLLDIITTCPCQVKYFKPLPNNKSSCASLNDAYSQESWDFNYKFQ